MSFNIKTEVNWEEETCLAANWEQCGFLFDRMISIDEITGLTLGLKFAVRLSIDEGRDPIGYVEIQSQRSNFRNQGITWEHYAWGPTRGHLTRSRR